MSRNLNRPSPPRLPVEQQREFEELLRQAQAPLASDRTSSEAELSLHPDAPRPVDPEFHGDQNPATGEMGGPKREPVKKWAEDGGDWSFKGRVSDF
jgi:hypothetical protein